MSLHTALRRQLKKLIRRIPILGPRLAPCAAKTDPAAATADSVAPVPVAPIIAAQAPLAAVAPVQAPVAPVQRPEPAPEPAPVVPASAAAANPVDDEKIRRHKEKAKRGVLKHLLEQGGSLGLGPMHDYSERRWFIAHSATACSM